MRKLIIAFGIVAVSATAVAEERTFAFSAQELGTVEGVVATYDRAAAFARGYCLDHLRGSRGLPHQSSCVSAVTEEIVDKVGDERLSAYAETGRFDGQLVARK